MTDRPSSPTSLEAELVALGRTLVIEPAPADLAERVLARVTGPDAAAVGGQPPARAVPRWAGTRRRLVAVAASLAALLVVALVPPVRAAVLDLLRIGGVSVREVPDAPSTPPSAPPSGPGAVMLRSVEEASDRVGFDVQVPSTLGRPTTVALSREGRVVELTWGSGPGSTRLDVFDGTLSFGYLKSVWEAVTPTQVSGQEAVWFAAPHLIQWTDRSGATVSSPPRVAGPTLVWVASPQGREITYRLEGRATLEDATAVAESAR